MADRIDTIHDSVKARGRQTMVDGVFPQPQVPQLSPSHHPVLPPRKMGNLGINPARPSQPANIAGRDGLGGMGDRHPANVAGGASILGRGLCRL